MSLMLDVTNTHKSLTSLQYSVLYIPVARAGKTVHVHVGRFFDCGSEW
jgi:hypothetical protein